jgi:hypothetical protein
MTKAAMAVVGLVLVVAGGGLAIFMEGKGVIHLLPTKNVSRQVPGDPPVTIGDGSLHAHSKNKWLNPDPSPGDGSVIQPLGDSTTTAPTFHQDGVCAFTDASGNPVPASAYLWTDDSDTFYDISPGNNINSWLVTITHGTTGPVVTVSAPGGVLQIKTSGGSAFDQVKAHDHDEFNRADNWPDVVTGIAVQGTLSTSHLPDSNNVVGTWAPSSPHHPHYTLAFCYH